MYNKVPELIRQREEFMTRRGQLNISAVVRALQAMGYTNPRRETLANWCNPNRTIERPSNEMSVMFCKLLDVDTVMVMRED